MKGFVLVLLLLMSQVSWAQFKNIMLSNQQDGRYRPMEPSIAIHPHNNSNIVAAMGVRRIAYTFDKGKTWKDQLLQSPYGVWGDVSLATDVLGNFYFFHLADPSGEGRKNDAWLDRMVMQRSGDGGITWTSGTSIGHNPPKDQDKEWPATHPSQPFAYLTWTQFDKYGSKDSSCHSNILFSMSSDTGHTWSDPVTINSIKGDCIDDDNTTEGAVPAVDKDGNVFVAWSNANSLWFNRSMDGGKTWMASETSIAPHYGGWAMDIPGLNRSNGMPVLVIDNSSGSFSGHLYVVWADQKNGKDDTDIWLSKSKDKGLHWTNPLRINQDKPGKHQFLPWLAIDQYTGNIYVVYYDRRNHYDLETDVFLAYSSNGGSSFKEIKISETPFIPTEEKFFGDYNNIAASNGVVTPIWTRMDDGVTSVWTCIIEAAKLPTE